MRGAYTAGALSWLVDNGIEADNAYGISTGAVHLCNYLMKNMQNLFDFSTDYIADKKFVGIRPILSCGRIVNYDLLFDEFLKKEIGFDISPLKDIKTDGYIGVYDLADAKTNYISIHDIDYTELKAACTLPVLGKTVHKDGHDILDGGITKMIPIEKAVEDGCNACIVITTKPGDYVRKPAKEPIIQIMKMCYPSCKQISEDYRVRHINYNDQISLIKKLEEEKKAVYIFPSKSSNVSRLGGSKEELRELYELGRSDMEARREEILTLFNKNV